jgi:hypothetical protein
MQPFNNSTSHASGSHSAELRRLQTCSQQGKETSKRRDATELRRSFSEIPHANKLHETRQTVLVNPLSPNYLSLLAPSCYHAEDQDAAGTRDPIFVVVVPGINLDHAELQRVCHHVEVYEERQLYNLLLLENPCVHVIYVSSIAVNNAFVRYLLTLRGESK